MFSQSLGQLRNAYPDADGLIEMCYAQCFMNPEFTTAKRLSERLGSNESLIKAKTAKVAEPHELTGTEYADKIIALIRGEKPLKLNKSFAYQDQTLNERMGKAR